MWTCQQDQRVCLLPARAPRPNRLFVGGSLLLLLLLANCYGNQFFLGELVVLVAWVLTWGPFSSLWCADPAVLYVWMAGWISLTVWTRQFVVRRQANSVVVGSVRWWCSPFPWTLHRSVCCWHVLTLKPEGCSAFFCSKTCVNKHIQV